MTPAATPAVAAAPAPAGFRQGLTFLLRRRRVLVGLAAWSAVEAVQTFATGYALARALDAGFLAGHAVTGLGWLAVAAVALVIGAYGTGRTYGGVAALVEPFRDALVRRVVTQALRDGDSAAVSRLTHQVEIARDAFAGLVMVARSFVFTAAGALVGLFLLAPVLLAVVVPPLVLGLVLFLATLRPMARRQEAFLAADEAVAQSLGEVCAGLRDIAASGAEQRARAETGALVDAELRTANALARWSVVRVGALAVAGRFPVVPLLAAAPWLLDHGVSPGALVGALTYLTQSLLPALQSLIHGLGASGARLAVVVRRLTAPPPSPAEASDPARGSCRAPGSHSAPHLAGTPAPPQAAPPAEAPSEAPAPPDTSSPARGSCRAPGSHSAPHLAGTPAPPQAAPPAKAPAPPDTSSPAPSEAPAEAPAPPDTSAPARGSGPASGSQLPAHPAQVPARTDFAPPAPARMASAPVTPALAVELRGVTFGYGAHAEPVVRELDLTLPAGTHLAVVGPSGVGKSTLAGLIAGLLEPWAGEVAVGGVAARDGGAVGRRVLIPQEAYVFSGTLGDNFRYLREGPVPDHEVMAAAEAIGAGGLVRRLGGGGLDATVVPGELSAGERQLIALVRAYLSPARVALLDEAACHLDPAAEARAERAFAARPGGTLVVIAHRAGSARRADRVLVMDGPGTVAGTHRDLPARSALYRDLMGAQTGAQTGAQGAQCSQPADPPHPPGLSHPPPPGLSHPPRHARDADRVDTVAGPGLAVDRGHVIAHGPVGQVQAPGDLADGGTLGRE
ncbi:ABC transporter ATP-binding protein [Streptomyces sp. NPDC026206]|uniref:ABC transporter ATP-binding protein n=1 Tax=Streptomyces sp. NPDC026206 TaxID=3157089 RepID=UPI0033ED6163